LLELIRILEVLPLRRRILMSWVQVSFIQVVGLEARFGLEFWQWLEP
jgi:hypothetical protein